MLVLIYLHVKNKIHQIFFSEDIAKILPTSTMTASVRTPQFC